MLGVFIGKIVAKDSSGKAFTVQSLVYVMKHGGDLLSREVLKQLGVLPPVSCNWPIYVWSGWESGQGYKGTERQEVFQPPGQCDPQSSLPCRCPLRTSVQVPDRLPVAALPENRKELEVWILKYHSPGAFNFASASPCLAQLARP